MLFSGDFLFSVLSELNLGNYDSMGNFTTPYSKPFLSVFHQNKVLYNFRKQEQSPKAGHCVCQKLIGFVKCAAN